MVEPALLLKRLHFDVESSRVLACSLSRKENYPNRISWLTDFRGEPSVTRTEGSKRERKVGYESVIPVRSLVIHRPRDEQVFERD